MNIDDDIDVDIDVEEINDVDDNNDNDNGVHNNTVRRYTCPIAPRLQTSHSSIMKMHFK